MPNNMKLPRRGDRRDQSFVENRGRYPIRANVWYKIIVKTPFSRSFLQTMFLTLSRAFPIINVEESLDDWAQIIPNSWGIAPDGAGH